MFDPKDAAEAVKWWDENGTIPTMEMGGLGPGYEQALQIAVVEICRHFIGRPIPEDPKAFDNDSNEVLSRIDKDVLGLSGTQAGAAKKLAWNFLRHGWDATIKKENDRRIMISRAWPKAPPAPKS